MPDTFHSRIQNALANDNLQAALDANAERRKMARQQAYASLPESWEVMRQRAHQIRAKTIAHLDEYLAQFIEQVESHGIIIHRAADAGEAVSIVLEIARQNNARLVAKSKTMVSEEIRLNHALGEAGIRAVETDLGEYIVQLRGEPPAHIITPAVHLRRADVGRTFQEKLGTPYTEDIQTMTEVAHKELRQVFLDAEIGISGVNFGVAESGTLCIVTNEGNGRMVTTLPAVHIALMGIERLVPTLEDLALMLYLLPRSATGQKLTVYTNLIHGPAVTTPGIEDPDGPQQRHLILVDNGRSAMRSSPLADALMCIRCGACLNACPVFREIGGHSYVNLKGVSSIYPGPIGSVVSPGLFGQAEFGHLARASSLCGACKDACPVDIDLPKLLLRIRAGKVPGTASQGLQPGSPNPPGYLDIGLRLYAWVAKSPWRFHAAQRLSGIFSRILAPGSHWMRLPAATGWGFSKDFPRPAARPFRDRWKKHLAARQNGKENTAIHENAGSQPPAQNYEISLPDKHPTLADQFSSELTALGGNFIPCNENDLSRKIIEVLRANEIQKLQAWKDGLPAGLLEQLREAGMEIAHDPDPSLRAGLTGSLAGIAESGTLALYGGAGRPLTASLLPEIHLAILHTRDIQANLPAVLKLRQIREASAAVLISGPSRTADIEMTLTIGVHGPREVHVFCIP